MNRKTGRITVKDGGRNIRAALKTVSDVATHIPAPRAKILL